MFGQAERTFIMIKPDGVQRGLIGKIIHCFERKGFKLVSLKFVQGSDIFFKKQYEDLNNRPFFDELIKYMKMGPVVPMVWEGLNVVQAARDMIGGTNPSLSKSGTIRGDLSIQLGSNIIHGSDNSESAAKEIDLWFTPEEQIEWKQVQESLVY